MAFPLMPPESYNWTIPNRWSN